VRGARIAVVVGLLAIAVTLVVVSLQSAPRLLYSNSQLSGSGAALGIPPQDGYRCELGQTLDARTGQLRLFAHSFGFVAGPIEVTVSGAGGSTRGSLSPRVLDGKLFVPIRQVDRAITNARICIYNRGRTAVQLAGNLTPLQGGANPFGLRAPNEDIRVDQYTPREHTWLGWAGTMADRFWLLKASWIRSWALWAVFAAMALIGAAAIVTVLRAERWATLGNRVPRALLACAAIAFANGAVWGVVTPTFQTPDEQAHFGYVQYLAETGKLPNPTAQGVYGPEQFVLVDGVAFSIEGDPTWSQERARSTLRTLQRTEPVAIDNQATTSGNNPPLYYGVQALPYRAARSLDALDRLHVMRLVSSLFAAASVALIFLFLRELLPRHPWAWTVGALMVALQPLFGFMSGGANNDNGLFLAGSAVLFGLTRALRRGLSVRLGVFVGAACLAGVLTKATFFGVLPGAAIGLLLAAWRSAPEHRRAAVTGVLASGVVLAAPFAFYLAVQQPLFDRSASDTTTANLASTGVQRLVTVDAQLSYGWQTYFPKLPFMNDIFPYYAPWEAYFKGFVGRFGWFQFSFEGWPNVLAAVIVAALLVLGAWALTRERRLRRRWPELVTLISLVLGLLAALTVAAYRYWVQTDVFFEQTRYLFSLVGIWGAIVAVGCVGAGRRWGYPLGVLLVVLAFGHDLFAQLLSIARYYA